MAIMGALQALYQSSNLCISTKIPCGQAVSMAKLRSDKKPSAGRLLVKALGKGPSRKVEAFHQTKTAWYSVRASDCKPNEPS